MKMEKNLLQALFSYEIKGFPVRDKRREHNGRLAGAVR
jgi:hypothetical protein